MLQDKTLFQTIDLEKSAIQLFRDTAIQGKPFSLAFSGGKDSIIILHLAHRAGIDFKAYYNVTTIDPPELLYFIRDKFPWIHWNHPEKPLLKRMLEKGFPPMRRQRWCCEEYKEQGGTGRIITGVRREESVKRANRKAVEFCLKDKSKIYVNPIIAWKETDVWEYIRKYNLPYCSLYDQGCSRIGCLFCPAASKKSRLREVERYPKYVALFIRYFQKLIDIREKTDRPIKNWKTGEKFFWWWITGESNNEDPDQGVLFE